MPTLVGRDDEVRGLRDLLAGREDSPHLVVLTGPAGVGKTATLNAALAGQRARLWRAHAVEWESAVPGAVLRQLGVGGADASVEDRVRRVAAAERVVVVVEGAHHADLESLRALSTAARSAEPAHLQVVLVRSDEARRVPPDVADFFDALADHGYAIPPLDAQRAGELMAALGRPLRPLVAERLAAFTGGIPQHLVDLAHEVPADLWTMPGAEFPAPAVVARRIADRCAALSPEARVLVESVSVLGSPSPIADAAALAGLADPLPAAEEAQTDGLLQVREPVSSTLVLAMDPLVRRAVLDGMGAVARAASHRRAAEVLSDPTARLRHRAAVLTAPDDDLAAELDAAATAFSLRGNWATSADLLAAAARLSASRTLREERTLRRIDALVGAGDALAAAAVVGEVDSMAETPLHHAVLGYLAIVQGRASEAESRLSRAWNLSGQHPDRKVRAMIAQRFVLHSLAQCQARRLLSWVDETCAHAPDDAPESMEARAIRGLGLSALGETEAALEEYRHLAAEAFPGAQAQRVVMARGWIDLAIGEVDAGCSELESALPTDVLGGSWRISLWAHAWLARGHFLRGRWDDALEVAERGIDLASRSGMTLLLPLLHWTTSQIHALRGDGGAEASLRRGDARPLDYSIMRVPAALAWAAEAETRGDYRSVLQALGPFAAGAFGDLVDEPGYWPWADVYANALVMEGRLAEAANFLDSREAAASLGHRAGRARLAAPRGRLLGATGDLAGAQRVFDEALDLLAGLPLEYDRARITFAYGQTLRRGGRRRDAESVLDAARRMFSALGAQTYVARCDRELGATEATGDGPLTRLLTGKERLVVDLAVRGRSNREIASDLYISEKTVQFHLTRVYAKFGVKSRTALAAVWLDDRDRTASVDPG